jgi:hypothetical protein
MGADYSFYVKSIATYAPAFLGYNNSVLARMLSSSTVQKKISENFLVHCVEISNQTNLSNVKKKKSKSKPNYL